MSAIDFGEWVASDLELKLGGHTYTVRPPTVEAAKMILAAAVMGEVHLGLVEGEVPPEVQAILDSIGDEQPALGEAHAAMVADGLPAVNIDRMAYYAVFYWARGKEYADTLAKMMWLPRDLSPGIAGDAAPKG
ncbi:MULTISPECIES: DUF7426 family protein [Cryobacterium]|uniref:DUF7426 family protein n=1 Tax=Cryobacterium TaxID=69578 RepID=UPI000CD46F16|nr:MULTISPECIES: hypothetical protein [Cryobacterium]POH63634.1 hypothetical protein C3B60_16095 [Cryobacterium zongtaii]TFC45577.1 hypothetical protein E3O57_07990 [Cryobacterium sp. TMN-39-2]